MTRQRHWTDEELLDVLYGLDPAKSSPEHNHLDTCVECKERFQAVSLRRRVLLDGYDNQSSINPTLLIRQRNAVMQRVEQSSSSLISKQALLAFAGAAAMVFGFLAYHPQSQSPKPAQMASSDTQFFAEIYSEVEQSEPRAVKPMHRLFQGHE